MISDFFLIREGGNKEGETEGLMQNVQLFIKSY